MVFRLFEGSGGQPGSLRYPPLAQLALVRSEMINIAYSLEETIERIFCLPVEFRLKGSTSLALLAESTGYLRHQEAIDVARLRADIRGRRGLIDSWLTYSMEKQANWGWFFEGPDRGIYLVGSRRHSIEGPKQLSDPAEACACFIKGEFDSLLGMHRSRVGSVSKTHEQVF